MKAFAATFTTIALAAASLSAQAQSSVQLTGTVDTYVGSMKMAGQERVASVGSGGLTTSWWGVKGVEDLGGGPKRRSPPRSWPRCCSNCVITAGSRRSLSLIR